MEGKEGGRERRMRGKERGCIFKTIKLTNLSLG
jgi:hypothetical protein